MNISRNAGIKPPRILLYGVRGIGKTSFGATTPSPIFLRTEDGLGALDVDSFDMATTYEDVVAQLRWLIEKPHSYKTLVLDSLSVLEQIIWQRVTEKYRDQKGNSVVSIEQFPYKSGYNFAADEMMPILHQLDAIRDKGMAMVLIAHARQAKQEPPDSDPFEKYAPSLHKEVAGRIMDWADAVLFVRYQMGVGEARGRARGKPVGTGQRVMHTTERPAYYAKNRYRLPDEMEFSWEAFVAAVAASQPTVKQQPTKLTNGQD